MVITRGGRDEESLLDEYGVSIWKDETSLELDGGYGCPIMWMHLFGCLVASDSLRPHGRQQPGFPVLHYLQEFAQTHPLSDWCHPTISSSVVPFSSCPQSFPALGSFPVSQLFASDGQSHWGSPFTQSHLHLNSIYQRNRALMYIYFNFVEKGNQPRQSCEDIQLLLT